jgi:hypothetical protein
LWTVKKAAKISAHEQWSPIPFMLLDDEEARELFADDIARNHKEDKVETDRYLSPPWTIWSPLSLLEENMVVKAVRRKDPARLTA